MVWDDFDIACASLCAWREARGEGRDGLRGVLHVIANQATLHGKSWAEIVYQPWQFSSMTAINDPQLFKVPSTPDQEFTTVYELAQSIKAGGDFDLTDGATNYYAITIPEPGWVKSMTFTVQLGSQRFYKLR